MTSSYNPDQSTLKDQVRFLLGDTSEPYDLTNEEIEYYLSEHNDNVHGAAIDCAYGVIATSTKNAASPTVGPFSIDYRAKADAYRGLIETLMERHDRHTPATPYVGGLKTSDTEPQDAHLEPPFAAKGIHDSPETDQYYAGLPERRDY